MNDWVPGTAGLTNAALDQKLEGAVIEHERSEVLICVYLTEVDTRKAYEEFGFESIYSYAIERFGFQERKTRYLLALGRKLDELPELRAALAEGKIGWCKASIIARVATREDETLWLDSALSLSVRELDRRARDGADNLAAHIRFWLTEDQRVVWENALEIARRVAGAEIAPGQALEYLCAEFIATWGADVADVEGVEGVEGVESEASPDGDEPLTLDSGKRLPEGRDAESRIEDDSNASWETVRKLVLDRDGFQCTYPGCGARRGLDAHHLKFRSHGGTDALWNVTTLCRFHHALLHAGQIRASGRAPYAIEFTPPKLMREAIARRRNRPSLWYAELDVRQWPAASQTPWGAAGASA